MNDDGFENAQITKYLMIAVLLISFVVAQLQVCKSLDLRIDVVEQRQIYRLLTSITFFKTSRKQQNVDKTAKNQFFGL